MPPSKLTKLLMWSLVESSCVYLDHGRFNTGACCVVGRCNLFREKNYERVGSVRLLQVLRLRNMQQNCDVSALAVVFFCS